MRNPMMLGATALGLTMMATLGTGVAAAKGPQDKACVDAVRAAGDWGKNLNPGKATFVAGDPGSETIDEIPAGVVYCGLGGRDVVTVNNGWFYGGDDIDTVHVNNGRVHGGDATDVVMENNGLFEGATGVDVVHVNNGVFDGGAGFDYIDVDGVNNGICIDVERGC